MARRIRVFLWRHQRSLALFYAGALALAWAAFLLFSYAMPASYDIGMAVAARAMAYRASFEGVGAARADIAAGRLDAARDRLERFLKDTRAVQRSQLETHAVVEAYELLSDLYLRSGRPGRAIGLLLNLTERLPLSYRGWYLRGLAERSGAGPAVAARSLGRAFRLTLNHPGVTETYLAVLADLPDIKRILWVADQFRRAEHRAAPIAIIKVGAPRGTLERRGLAWAGIPVEHGRFFRQFEARGLTRGERQVVSCPPELFAERPSSGKTTVQLRFEHVYGDLRIVALRCRIGGERTEFPLDPKDVRTLHRPHSSREAFGEFDLDLDPRATEFEIVYSCPEHVLSDKALAIIQKARANVTRGGG